MSRTSDLASAVTCESLQVDMAAEYRGGGPPNRETRIQDEICTTAAALLQQRTMLLASTGAHVNTFAESARQRKESRARRRMDGGVDGVLSYMYKYDTHSHVRVYRVTRYPLSISRMTVSILSSPISLAHILYRFPG